MSLPYKLGEDISGLKRMYVEVPIDDALNDRLEDIWRKDISSIEQLSAELIELVYDRVIGWVSEREHDGI